MDRVIEKRISARAVELGNSGDANALPELLAMLPNPAPMVRRLAASAIGKLAGLSDARAAVAGLQPLLRDPHPQVRQYAVKALSAYGIAAVGAIADLRDMAANAREKDYNRRDAEIAIAVIQEAQRIAEAQAEHHCQRCHVSVGATEYARSQRAFQRVFCDKCFDEVYLERRNFDTRVELNKTIEAKPGTLVQSGGERLIAEWLAANNVAYRYDERIRIVEGYTIRPDFYLPEFDVYIEYWGMDTADYKIGMLKKQKLYQQEGKRLVSLYPADKPRMATVLREKLRRYIRLPDETEAEHSLSAAAVPASDAIEAKRSQSDTQTLSYQPPPAP